MAFSFRRSVLKFHNGAVYNTLQDDCQGICRFLSFLLLKFGLFRLLRSVKRKIFGHGIQSAAFDYVPPRHQH